ncbi:MAG: PqqD family protein [Pseudomonadota bacterium]
MSGSRSRQNGLTREQALSCMPEKNRSVQEIVLDSGEMVLTYPVAYRPMVIRLRKFMGKGDGQFMEKRLQLDRLGSHVWSLIDGSRSVRTIVREFSIAWGLDTREAEVSVTQFLKSLGEKGIIGLRQP